MKKLMAGLCVAGLVLTPLALAQQAGGRGAGRQGRGPGGGPGGEGRGAQMQERMREAWASLDKEACFKAMDTNGDGTISKDEFQQADLQAVFGERLREAMAQRAGGAAGVGAGDPAQWDKNGDGKVTADEFPGGEEAFKRMLERGDKDGDGALSLEEVRAVREARGGGRRQQGPAR